MTDHDWSFRFEEIAAAAVAARRFRTRNNSILLILAGSRSPFLGGTMLLHRGGLLQLLRGHFGVSSRVHRYLRASSQFLPLSDTFAQRNVFPQQNAPRAALRFASRRVSRDQRSNRRRGVSVTCFSSALNDFSDTRGVLRAGDRLS